MSSKYCYGVMSAIFINVNDKTVNRGEDQVRKMNGVENWKMMSSSSTSLYILVDIQDKQLKSMSSKIVAALAITMMLIIAHCGGSTACCGSSGNAGKQNAWSDKSTGSGGKGNFGGPGSWPGTGNWGTNSGSNGKGGQGGQGGNKGPIGNWGQGNNNQGRPGNQGGSNGMIFPIPFPVMPTYPVVPSYPSYPSFPVVQIPVQPNRPMRPSPPNNWSCNSSGSPASGIIIDVGDGSYCTIQTSSGIITANIAPCSRRQYKSGHSSFGVGDRVNCNLHHDGSNYWAQQIICS